MVARCVMMRKGKYKLTIFRFAGADGQLLWTQLFEFRLRPLTLLRQHKPIVFGTRGLNVKYLSDEEFKQLLFRIFRFEVSSITSFSSIVGIDKKRAVRLDKFLKKVKAEGVGKYFGVSDELSGALWSMEPVCLTDDDLSEIATHMLMEDL